MKKFKPIVLFICLALCGAVLFYAGVVLLPAWGEKKKETQTKQTEEKAPEADAEMVYSEKLDMTYPATPKEPGFQISYEKDMDLPDDDLLKTLSVYYYHRLFGFDCLKEQEERAEKLAAMLLKDFFPGKSWVRKDVNDSYQENHVYRLKGDKTTVFQYTANKDGGDNSQLLCEKGKIKVPKPEDGDWDQAFRDFSDALLKSFQIGLWDGKNHNMDVSFSKNVSGGNGSYWYKIQMDGIFDTQCLFDSDGGTVWAAVCYEDGCLVSMNQMAQIVLDKSRPFKPAYAAMEDAWADLQDKVEKYLKNQASNQYYYCAKCSNLDLQYQSYYEKRTKTYYYVPILTVVLDMDIYDFNNGSWEKGQKISYALQLETGNGSEGFVRDEEDWWWQVPITDE